MERPAREFGFTSADFRRVVRLVGEHAGIALGADKEDLVYGRLARRLRALGLRRMRDYIELLGDDDSEEFTHFVNALTTNVTSFFREEHHFHYLTDEFLPEVRARKPGSTLRIWSAGCSTGMEPYSIAIALLEAIERTGPMSVEIFASDLDSSVLATAERGVYPADALKGVSDERRGRWFREVDRSDDPPLRVHAAVRRLVSFEQLNLVGAWGPRIEFDAIFCRNTAIYFDAENRAKLIQRFLGRLPVDGLLVLGHSETVGRAGGRFRSCGHAMYRKLG